MSSARLGGCPGRRRPSIGLSSFERRSVSELPSPPEPYQPERMDSPRLGTRFTDHDHRSDHDHTGFGRTSRNLLHGQLGPAVNPG